MAVGFTLVEMLVVIGIIMILMLVLGGVAMRSRENANIQKTKYLISNLQDAFAEFKALNRDYPAELTSEGFFNQTFPHPDPYIADATNQELRSGRWRDKEVPNQALPVAYLYEQPSGSKVSPVSRKYYKESELDSTKKYLVDAWGNYIRYRKFGSNQYLIWSNGPNGKIEIGVGQEWDPKAEAYIGTANLTLKAIGDDISSETARSNINK